MDEKCNLQCRKLKIHNRIYRNYHLLSLHPKFFNNFQDIHHCIVNLRNVCLCTIIRMWYHAKSAISRWITIWALKQNGRKVTQNAVFTIMRHNERDGVSNHQPHDCLLNRLFKAPIKENMKAPRHWSLWGEFTVDGSNAENISIWWRHHDLVTWYPKENLLHLCNSCLLEV